MVETGAVQVHREGVLGVDPAPHHLGRVPVGEAEQEQQHSHGGQLSRGEAGTAIEGVPGDESLVIPEPVEVVTYPHGRGTRRIAGPCRPNCELSHHHAEPGTNGRRPPREDSAVQGQPKHPGPLAPCPQISRFPTESLSGRRARTRRGPRRCPRHGDHCGHRPHPTQTLRSIELRLGLCGTLGDEDEGRALARRPGRAAHCLIRAQNKQQSERFASTSSHMQVCCSLSFTEALVSSQAGQKPALLTLGFTYAIDRTSRLCLACPACRTPRVTHPSQTDQLSTNGGVKP